MRRKPKVGLLPLYIELYDEVLPSAREVLEPFLKTVSEKMGQEGLAVTTAPVCRIASEFQEAVDNLEDQDIDAIVTLHLAYSPSLESADALCSTDLPLIILDTTMDFDFGRDVSSDRILYNHGIHGVQDMASVLRRRERPFEIAAGHFENSEVVSRVASIVRAAYAARCLTGMNVLRIGESFKGMGDFAVENELLGERFDITVTQISPDDLSESVEAVTSEEVENEMVLDKGRFEVDLSEQVHSRSVRIGLGLRRYLEEGGYGAFSMSFLDFNSKEGVVNTVPFLEASKAMGRGIGYAGEGDVLTASLVGALCCGFGKATFTEIFCPDWKGGSLFLSHMGETNPDIGAEKPLLFEKPYRFSNAENPAVVACAPAPGEGVLVNLAPGPDGSFSLIVVPVEILEDSDREDLRQTIRGWIRPSMELDQFLEVYSTLGGTHHSALVLGDVTEALAGFASFVGIEAEIV